LDDLVRLSLAASSSTGGFAQWPFIPDAEALPPGKKVGYTTIMTDFGHGPTLREFNPYVRDSHERHERILDVVERNSVIEGLPPLTDEIRQRILQQLRGIADSPRAPIE
jgi:hypothetical protein